MRISDWSSDVCSSDLSHAERLQRLQARIRFASLLLRPGEELRDYHTVDLGQRHLAEPGWTTRGRTEHRAGGVAATGTHIRERFYRADAAVQIGRASCRARVCQHV